MLRHLTAALFVFVVAAAQSRAADPATVPAATRPAWPGRQIVSGVVEDAIAHRGPGAILFICDAVTGMPYSPVTDHPFTDLQIGSDPPPIALAATGNDGRFYIRGVFPGTYRVLAQSWEGVGSVRELGDDRHSDNTTLHGIVENVQVVEGRDPPPVLLKPIGSASVNATVELNDTFVLVSTEPPNDVLLGPLAWKGEFLRHLVGATYIRDKHATMHGLPEGKLYLCAMFNDRRPAFGASSVVATAGQTVEARVELQSPQNGPIQLPARLLPLKEQMERDQAGVLAAIQAAVVAHGWDLRDTRARFDVPLDANVRLPGGQTASIRDILTVEAYERFNSDALKTATKSDATTQQTPP